MKNIGFVGAGNMGEAYISALCDEKTIFFYEVNNERAEYISGKYNVSRSENLEELINSSDFIVLAIKPQVMNKVLNSIKDVVCLEKKVFISIAAGLEINKLRSWISKEKENVKMTRVMPNTPALIKKGISGVAYSENISNEEKDKINKILKATGEVVEVEESKIDIVTAVSGSGPAFVMVMINSMADGAVKLGMNKTDALKFAVETFIGTAELIKATGDHPEVLKDKVTSPGGTTAAGLYAMEKNGIRKSLIETVEATYRKAKELS